MNQPSRVLLIVAGALTQVVGAACLVSSLAALPFAHDLHTRTHSILASIVAALATIVCGTLIYRGRLIPIALAAGLDVGFAIGLPRGSAAIGTLLHVLPQGDVATAGTLVTLGSVTMFVAAILCILAIPSALRLRAWARAELAREELAVRGAEGEQAKRAAQQSRSSTGAIVPAAASTLEGVGPKLMPTQVIHAGRRGTPVLIVGVAVTLIAIGIVVITAASGSSPASDASKLGSGAGSGEVVMRAGSGSALVVDAGDAGDDAATPSDPPVEQLTARLHLALESMKPDELALLFDAKVFAFGVEAHEVAEGRDAVVAMLRHDLGTAANAEVTTRFAQTGHEGDAGWFAEAIDVGGKAFVATGVADLRDGAWSIAALHWSVAMPNAEAYKAARKGTLEPPDAIPDAPDAPDPSDLAKAMRLGFASTPAFVAARSTRPDALNYGSAPGERVQGGDNIKKIFSRIKATIRLHDAVAVGTVGTHGGWGAANVDFTDADRDGTEVTQTFRVLVAWVQESGGWRMVQTQWSNAR
ncbi:MAG: nuclear transport factor 2 family protein [Kofleriaceae bacterium]